MSFTRALNEAEIHSAMEEAARRRLPVVLVVRHQNQWRTFDCHAMAVREDALLVLLSGEPQHNSQPHPLAPGEAVGLAFRVAHRKHMAACSVLAVERVETEDGAVAGCVHLARPAAMHRMGRSQPRVEMPSDVVIRGAFWPGGRERMPTHEDPGAPVWSGRILDMSLGGCSIRTDGEAGRYFQAGDVLGLRILFGPQRKNAVLDTQLRHVQPDGEMAVLGFQFLSPEDTPEGEEIMSYIRRLSELADSDG